MKPVSCSCDVCRSMCAESTCLPTPDEARALIRAGHGKRLATYIFAPNLARCVGPAPKGSEGASDLMHTRSRCTFFSEGKCELHDAGLKPLEGRLSLHDRPWQPIREQALDHWKGARFNSVISMLEKA